MVVKQQHATLVHSNIKDPFYKDPIDIPYTRYQWGAAMWGCNTSRPSQKQTKLSL